MIRTASTVACTLVVGAIIAVVFEARQAGDWLMLLSFFVMANFTFWYSTKSRWKLLNAGRSLLYVSLAVTFLLGQNSLSVFLGSEYFGRAVFRVEMYFAIIVAGVGMSWVLWKIQQRDPTLLPPERRYKDISEIDLDKKKCL